MPRRSSRSLSRSVSPDEYGRTRDLDCHDEIRVNRQSRSRSPSPVRRESHSPRRRRDRSRSRSHSRERRSRSFSLDCHDHEGIRNAWREVKSNPENFEAWMVLLNLVEQTNDLSIARDVFDRFLARYPFCYGFWKKYAEMERRNQNFAESLKVSERGILAIPLSIDLWLGFLSFMRELAPHSDGGLTKLRELYDRALSMAGQEYNSDRLWQDAIAWEESQGEWNRVAEIYDRLLRTPTAMFKSHYERFESIINTYEPDVLLSQDEYSDIFDLVRKHINVGIDQIVIDEEVIEDGPPDAIEDSGEVKPRIIKRKRHHPEALAFFRAEILARRRRRHQDTAVMINNRLPFEEQIKRPYFHVKPLEKQQLKNWRLYLDFEIGEEDDDRTAILFERCLIACALYEDFWIKYARWTWKSRGSLGLARDIFRRALVHCPRRVNLHLAYSAFEEALGDYGKAGSILDSFDRQNPGYAAIQLRKIGMQRRRVENDKKPDYSVVISNWEKLIHSPETTRHLSSYYSIKLARFHLKTRNDRRLAEKIIKRALERDRDNVQLLLQLIDLAYTNPDFSQTAVIEAFDYAIKSNISDEDKIRISQRKIDFIEDLSYDIEILQEHQEAHSALLSEIENPPQTTRKRRYEKEERHRDREDSRRSRYSDGRDRRSVDTGVRQGIYGQQQSGYYMQGNVYQQPYQQGGSYYNGQGYY